MLVEVASLSGAFEVAYNGQRVWSKIESGRFPQMNELQQALVDVMGEALPYGTAPEELARGSVRGSAASAGSAARAASTQRHPKRAARR